jgi:hypothetical protein
MTRAGVTARAGFGRPGALGEVPRSDIMCIAISQPTNE